METGKKQAKKSFLTLLLIMVISSICGTAFAEPMVIYVDANAAGGNNGSSWEDAYISLQSALSAAVSGDEIWVAAGTYRPTTDADRTIFFVMRPGVAIYGGFAGTEATRDQRNWVANQTILSGDIGQQGNNSDNSYHVVIGTSNATLDGFTITSGNANGSNYSEQYGGGMANDNSSPTVTNCTFSSNTASYCGGMGNDFGSNPTVTNCTFSGNSASYSGGGMGNEYSSPTVTNCTFTDNSAYNDSGGGMYNESDSSPIVTSCTFSGNTASYSGGGMDNEYGSSPIVTNCSFSGNSAYYGGGMANYESSPTLTNCTFGGNSAYYSGGMDNYGSYSMVTNCILWGNFPDPIYDDYYSYSIVRYCDFEGGLEWGGEGNIDEDPLFAGTWDLRLQAGSPCIDAGDNSSVPADISDLDGDGDTTEPIPFDLEGWRRIVDGDGDGQMVVDMGAFEYNDRVEMPTFEPDAGGYMSDPEVVIRCSTSEATIHYTTNGLTPTQYDTVIESGGNVLITVEPATTLKARAFKDDWTPSDVKTAVYYRTFIRYVSTTGNDNSNGLSWATAKQTVQAAINTAQSGDEIWVAAGTYVPTTGPDRTISFITKQDVAIYGGFAGTETSREQRDWVANQTILSGDIGIQGDNSDNSYHVVVGVSGATLDGFTITGGNANGTNNTCGGGMDTPWFNGPIVTNCTFIGNSAQDFGGGMNSYDGGARVTNCRFIGNTASRGGGMFNNHYSNLVVTDCTFIGNTATDDGGGMWNGFQSSPTVTNCTFINNSATYGGGMQNYYIIYAAPTVVNCTFIGNTAQEGGGIHIWESGPYNQEWSLKVVNCTFIQNSADRGGGMFSCRSSPTVTNCTFSNNISPNGTVLACDSYQQIYPSSVTMANCIIWNGPAWLWNNDNSTITITYSDVYDGLAGIGNINADPCFVGNGNYRLLSGSPCIDAGNNNAVPPDYADLDGDGNTTEQTPLDLDGFPRFIDDLLTSDTGYGPPPIVDMGAYEFLRSDINSNGGVDFVDIALFASQWFKSDCGECGGADLTGDGQVNWDDLRELVEWWLAGTSD